MILRYAAFTDSPEGGNPAGVVLDAAGLSDDEMQRIAAEVGLLRDRVRSRRAPTAATTSATSAPLAEVPFCGHATIATAVALAERSGAWPASSSTRAEGEVPVNTSIARRPRRDRDPADERRSPTWRTQDRPTLLEARACGASMVRRGGPRPAAAAEGSAYAGVRHLIIGVASRERLARPGVRLRGPAAKLMAQPTTSRPSTSCGARIRRRGFHARDPFPRRRRGGGSGDRRRGSRVGAYLRELGLVHATGDRDQASGA